MLRYSHKEHFYNIQRLRDRLEKFNVRNNLSLHEIYPGPEPIEIKLWATIWGFYMISGRAPSWLRAYKTLTRRTIKGDIFLESTNPDDFAIIKGEKTCIYYRVFKQDWRKYSQSSIFDAALWAIIRGIKYQPKLFDERLIK